MKKRQGFTLVEIILSLALIGILLLIASPNTNIYSNHLQNKEINTIRRDLMSLRSRAITEGASYKFHVNEDGSGYFIQNIQSGIIQRVNFEHGVKLSPHQGFTFTSDGSVLNPSTLYIKNSHGARYTISVGVATGKITLLKVDI